MMGMDEKTTFCMSNFMMNSVGVMLTYSTYYGIVAAMVMPTVFDDDNSDGIDKSYVYTSMVISSAVVLICAPIITAIISRLGTSFTLVCGTLCISAFYPTMLFPNPVTVYVGVPVNAIGFAFLRAGSVAILTDDVAKGNMNNGRNSIIQCLLFMFSIIFGNLLIYFITSQTNSVSHSTRLVIAVVLFATNVIGALLYCTTKLVAPKNQLVKVLGEDIPILPQKKKNKSSFARIRRNSMDLLSDCKQLLFTYTTQFKILITPFYNNIEDSTATSPTMSRASPMTLSPTLIRFLEKGKKFFPTGILNMDTIAFIIPMIASACYCMSYAIIFPTQAGLVINKTLVPVFGIFVGTGEAIGYVAARFLTSNLGVKVVVILANILGLCCFTAAGILFPLEYDDSPLLVAGPTCVLILGFFIGLSDVTFNYSLSTLVRRVYAESYQNGYAFYGCILNLCCIIITILADVYCLLYILIICAVTTSLGTLCLFYLQCRVDEMLKRDLNKGYEFV